MANRIFLSGFHAEFGDEISTLASELRARGYDVITTNDVLFHKDEFENLALLEECVASSNAVIAFAGYQCGPTISINSAAHLVQLLPSTIAELSREQLEIMLALDQNKPLLLVITNNVLTSSASEEKNNANILKQKEFKNYLLETRQNVSKVFSLRLNLY